MPGSLDRLSWKLRPLVPRQVKWLGRPLLAAADPIAVAAFRRRTGEERPIPPRPLRAAVGSPSIERYFAAGRANADGLMSGLRLIDRTIGDFESVLDFGCGCGRTLQHLPLAAGPAFHGSDVDADAVGWASRHLRPARFETNGFAPPLPYADDSFDLIYAISVFTHLEEGTQLDWLNELARVSKPGGVCLLSTHGEAVRRWNWHHMGVPRRLATRLVEELPGSPEPFVFVPMDPAQRPPGGVDQEEQSGWGLAFHLPGYIHERWGEVLDVVEILPGAIDSFQDLVVLRAPAAS